MSAIRVSGRKNSGINIAAGFNSQDGENAYYCNCYNCCCLIDSSKEKKILSHGKMLVPPGGTNSCVGGTNNSTNGIKHKYPPY